jgi:hypothetical protein
MENKDQLANKKNLLIVLLLVTVFILGLLVLAEKSRPGLADRTQLRPNTVNADSRLVQECAQIFNEQATMGEQAYLEEEEQEYMEFLAQRWQSLDCRSVMLAIIATLP